jgi:hypothetical protein
MSWIPGHDAPAAKSLAVAVVDSGVFGDPVPIERARLRASVEFILSQVARAALDDPGSFGEWLRATGLATGGSTFCTCDPAGYAEGFDRAHVHVRGRRDEATP